MKKHTYNSLVLVLLLSIFSCSDSEKFDIEKGKVVVQVFEVSTDFASFMDGIDADNKGINLQKPLMVGSMVEPKINGNWGE